MTQQKTENLIIIGNGMAGLRLIDEILARDPLRFNLCIFGDEPFVGYNRIQLSHVMEGTKNFAEIITHPPSWYSENKIDLITGEAVVKIDRQARTVTGSKGSVRSYDRLVLATGSAPSVPPIKGINRENVFTFRDQQDVLSVLSLCRKGGKAVVIGGGFLGLEAAHALQCRGMEVTVLHLMPRLMEQQLDDISGRMLAQKLTDSGLHIVLNAQTTEICGETLSDTEVKLADGQSFKADLIIVATGIKPRISLAKEAGLTCWQGICTDSLMRTSDEAVYAVGECAEYQDQVIGIVAPIWEMVKSCAEHLVFGHEKAYVPGVYGLRVKISGIEMLSTVNFHRPETSHPMETLVFQDESKGIYKKLTLLDDKLFNVVLYGNVADGTWYTDLIKKGINISLMRDKLIFGPVSEQNPNHPAAKAVSFASLSDDAEICGCNGITKGQIVEAIQKYSLTTLEEIKQKTKAAASCGGCSSQVEAILAETLGDQYRPASKEKPVCTCTDLSHAKLRKIVAAQKFSSVTQMMQTLAWKTKGGCAKCLPALNYYLLCANPGLPDDLRARLPNERMDANIQKDGTFSVVPRIWGGVTTAKDLKAIADIAEKYHVPTVKITGGQRITLVGIKTEDLPGMWADLNQAGFISGDAYGKALRTAKTCLGSEWCRFGTQNTTQAGIMLEKFSYGIHSPHKIKIGVSGCGRNCAEIMIKDFGVLGTEQGWQIFVGGNGGTKLREADFWCKVASEKEIADCFAAFIQLYREEAYFLERTADWLERVGFSSVKQTLDNRETFVALQGRFLTAQKFAQHDPWASRAKGRGLQDFTPLCDLR